MPPPSVTVKTEVKTEVKKEEVVEKKENDEEEDVPCTKMTMRLRRNISNPQCVSTTQVAAKVKFSIVKFC